MELFGARVLQGEGAVDCAHARAVDAVLQFVGASAFVVGRTGILGGGGTVQLQHPAERGPALTLGEVVGGERAHPVVADVRGRVLRGEGEVGD